MEQRFYNDAVFVKKLYLRSTFFINIYTITYRDNDNEAEG